MKAKPEGKRSRMAYRNLSGFAFYASLLMAFLIFGWPANGRGQTEQPVYGTLTQYDLTTTGYDSIPLQPIIDNAEPGQHILLKPAVYTGPVEISTDGLVIDGQGKAIIDGLGKTSVIFINADSVTVKNVVIRHSGGSFDKLDSGVRLKGDYNVIENCRIEDVLFGVDIWQCNHNRIIHNEITSLLHRPKAIKGDAIRLWYSKFNIIRGNYWHHVRDMVVWYSAENLFQGNKGIGNRYGIHFMYSHNNRIQNNVLINNSVGVFLMYSERTIMTGNLIKDNHIGSGMALGMKETSSNQILNNRFIYCTEGIHVDVSPYVLEQKNTIEHNEIAFCGTAIYFHTNQEGNLFKHNYFHNNLTQVYPEVTTARFNVWDNNYWDDYQGFDRNDDNIGDIPYILLSYSGHLWDFDRYMRFFYGAPILAVLDFLNRLAPFSKPKFVLEDKKPVFRWPKNDTFTPVR
ncbi:nitrous oxide reductase family maturation protein NosD [Candidatus Sulfidibacterium hydrothermale]|uniref:nitrous oxide reductase family maturation protein NosD n=1 Tax=Candidatus Sulfidibacterium hydrothermale TaxID=2875962 RepID=UPI001F0B40F7|nr:nitrous oxide reductase family maturation protein NosD [Candidatus Sulfidibacterium hydrothermale]UBM61767.1 nitrous oxide reductase family maturation protein NosD [Candidatus Sulfidibacterium hydrothermale]